MQVKIQLAKEISYRQLSLALFGCEGEIVQNKKKRKREAEEIEQEKQEKRKKTLDQKFRDKERVIPDAATDAAKEKKLLKTATKWL